MYMCVYVFVHTRTHIIRYLVYIYVVKIYNFSHYLYIKIRFLLYFLKIRN